MNLPPAHRPESSIAPPEQREVPSEGGPAASRFSNFAFRIPNFPLSPEPLNPLTPRRPPAAFTLIELMVAAAITTLLLLGMTGIFDQAMKAWRLSSRRADAEREVRATLSTLQRDLRSLWSETNLPVYRFTSKPQIPFINPSESPEYSQSVALFFLTRLSTNQQPDPATDRGDICGVGYYVAWDDDTKAYNLYRYLQGSSDQRENLRTFLADARPLPLRDGLFPATSPRRDEVVGANVINFRAEFKTVPPLGSAAGSTIIEHQGPLILARRGIWTLSVPSTVSFSNAAFISTNRTPQSDATNAIGISLENANVPANARAAFPTNQVVVGGMSYVQLELTAYGTEAVRSFTRSNDWLNSENIRKFGRAYLWRVEL